MTVRLTFEEHACDSLADAAAAAGLSSCAQDQDRDDVGAETSRGQRDCNYHESDFSAEDVLAKYRVLGRHSRCVSVANERGAPFSHRRIAKVRRAASARARARTGDQRKRLERASGYDTGIAKGFRSGYSFGITRRLGRGRDRERKSKTGQLRKRNIHWNGNCVVRRQTGSLEVKEG